MGLEGENEDGFSTERQRGIAKAPLDEGPVARAGGTFPGTPRQDPEIAHESKLKPVSRGPTGVLLWCAQLLCPCWPLPCPSYWQHSPGEPTASLAVTGSALFTKQLRGCLRHRSDQHLLPTLPCTSNSPNESQGQASSSQSGPVCFSLATPNPAV